MVASRFEDAPSLVGTMLRDQNIEIELRAQFRSGHRGRRKRKALQYCIAEPHSLKFTMNCSQLCNHRRRSCRVVSQVLLQTGMHIRREYLDLFQLIETVKQVE